MARNESVEWLGPGLSWLFVYLTNVFQLQLVLPFYFVFVLSVFWFAKVIWCSTLIPCASLTLSYLSCFFLAFYLVLNTGLGNYMVSFPVV